MSFFIGKGESRNFKQPIMPSNFDFLRDRYPTKLYEYASHAESLIYTAPRASFFYTRFTLEQAVHWLYANDSNLQLPEFIVAKMNFLQPLWVDVYFVLYQERQRAEGRRKEVLIKTLVLGYCLVLKEQLYQDAHREIQSVLASIPPFKRTATNYFEGIG